MIQYGWMLIYVVGTLYTFGWDVCMDWRLGRVEHGLLRDRKMFRSTALYYVAIGADFVLRFLWMATIVPHSLVMAEAGTVEWFGFQGKVLNPRAPRSRRPAWPAAWPPALWPTPGQAASTPVRPRHPRAAASPPCGRPGAVPQSSGRAGALTPPP